MSDAWGGSWGGAFGASFGSSDSGPQAQQDTIGSKRKKLRGPYSDPRIFEEYVERCIAERNAPRTQGTEVAIIKEALVEAVEKRAVDDAKPARSALMQEVKLVEQLADLESSQKSVLALIARKIQIERQLQALEEEEAGMLLAIFDEM